MKATLLIITIAVGVSGYVIQAPIDENVQSTSDKSNWIYQQRLILNIFMNMCGEFSEVDANINEMFWSNQGSEYYTKPDVLTHLQNLINGEGLLRKEEIFSELNEGHLNELKVVYEVFRYAKYFETFHTAALWANQNVNCGLFMDAFYAALLERKDTKNIQIPAPYEILTNYFVNKNVMIKGSLLLSGSDTIPMDDFKYEGNTFTIDSNYTANFYGNDQESKLAYFLEDVGLNTYYYLKMLQFAPWANKENPTNINGERIFHLLKKLVTRYDLERYANGYTEIESINWNVPNIQNYDPMLIYTNGKEFPQRIAQITDVNTQDIDYLTNIENNIETIVIHLLQNGYSKSEIMNQLMDMLVLSDESYENVALRVIENKDNGLPSTLHHYMTRLRDSVYWQILKKIVKITEKGLAVIPMYTREELYFPGVEVTNVEVKKVMTYFDVQVIDATHILKSNLTRPDLQIKINQPRLNHKPFSIKISITSILNQKGLVKIYLGPKLLPYEVSMKREQFMEIHAFQANLKTGSNVITIKSDQMTYLQTDFSSINTIIKDVEDLEFGLEATIHKDINDFTEFPSHIMLPKGSSEGVNVQFLVLVAPFVKATPGGFSMPEFNSAILSPGYPFDLGFEQSTLFNLPNAKFKEVMITHKGDNKITDSGSYDPASRPVYDYASKGKGSFDYTSKKEVYGKNFDYKQKQFDRNNDLNKSNSLEPKDLDSITSTVTDHESYVIDNNAPSDFMVTAIKDNSDKSTERIDDNKDLLNESTKNFIESSTTRGMSRGLLKMSANRRKIPSVFDYIAHILDDNSDDESKERVYE